jgi:hypothetical protein
LGRGHALKEFPVRPPCLSSEQQADDEHENGTGEDPVEEDIQRRITL